ncbi:retrotransposon protein, putative, ty1-copia subclass [Tanacetum coccineum]|uniref:Retrotransposon protein, putative, ty1-copia subclass n=1 Tax=Tanacetum coccineum TaxID=301880 RepID=A0ABQ5H0G7_9ASTR
MYVIEQPLPTAPAADSQAQVLSQWNAVYDAYNEVACLMLGIKGKPVAAYVLKMKGYVEQLERLGYVLPQDLSVSLILNGLTSDFAGFGRNYNMHNMGKTIVELHVMLIEYEKGLPKRAETPQVMAIRGGKIQKTNKKLLQAKGKGKAYGKGKDKQVYIPKPKNPKPTTKEHPDKDDTCHHCKEVGHWRRNCPVYLAKLLKKKKQVGTASSSENGVRAQVEAIGSFDLVLPNGLCFTDYRISVSKNDILYFNAIPRDGIYEIDMHNLVPNVNSIYNVSNKRAKHNLDSTYLWHYCLAYISKKHIEKLQQEGLLKSTDDESFDQCVSCLSDKMTRKPFPYRTERATDLLGIIHTDVCGPLRHVSRQGASYFITFTDDYIRYGYVYLLKHKHEVFETFKVFKNELENQLGKTIKALRSDRGGEYISQEFKDYLKACGIVQQLTPPYTPQHNSVFEKRNRTLLDMSATHILNMVPTKKVDKTPYELLRMLLRGISEKTNTTLRKGYPKKTMGYYFYFSPENKIVVARYVKFFEKSLITQKVSGRAIDLEEIQDEDTSPSKITSEIPMEVEGFEPHQEEVILITVGSKWIFKKKTDIDGIVHTYKARLVAKGYTQLYGVDYEETFSTRSTLDLKGNCKILARSMIMRYGKWMSKTAFLNGYLDKDIYMVQPEGFVDPKANGSNVTFLILYVDAIIIMGNHILSFQSVKDYLGKCFAMKDLGETTFILGIKIYRDRSKRLIGLSQSAYMDKILKRYKMDNSKRGHIPMQERLDLNKTQGASTPEEVKRMQNVPYASVVGSIINPEAELRVNCYCDAGFETDRVDIKSQPVCIFVLNGVPVDWKSSKQSTTAMSATEAEYIATSEAAMEAVWIRKFISGLGIVPTINKPIKMFCDSSAALLIAN